MDAIAIVDLYLLWILVAQQLFWNISSHSVLEISKSFSYMSTKA